MVAHLLCKVPYGSEHRWFISPVCMPHKLISLENVSVFWHYYNHITRVDTFTLHSCSWAENTRCSAIRIQRCKVNQLESMTPDRKFDFNFIDNHHRPSINTLNDTQHQRHVIFFLLLLQILARWKLLLASSMSELIWNVKEVVGRTLI